MTTDIQSVLALAREGAELAAKATKGPMVVEYDRYGLWPDYIRTKCREYEQDRRGESRNMICMGVRDQLATMWQGNAVFVTHHEESATFELFAHAGTHYATLCAAVIEMGEALEAERAKAKKAEG